MTLRTIYIDVLITVNIFIDFFLIICTKKFLHIRVGLKRLILGSVLGGILSLTALLPHLFFGINILVDIAGACIIVFASFGKCNIKNYIKRICTYFSLSFSFCGIMIAIYTAFKPNGMAIYNDVVYFNISPILLIILTLACYYILNILKRLTKGVIGSSTCNIEILVNNTWLTFISKIDTGCNLKEPFSGNYVIVTERSLLQNYYPPKEQIRIIPFETIGGNGIINGFRPEKIKINGKEFDNNIYIGICENVINGDIKSLIPNEIISDVFF